MGSVHRIVVTGAGQGIGRAIARAFAALPDAHLALVGRSRQRLDGTAAACRAAGARADVFVCDVTDDAAVARTAEFALASMGTPTCVVNNAGAFEPGGVLDLTGSSFRAQIEVNLTSAFLVTSAFLPSMLAAGTGHLVFMGSTASIMGYPSGAAYCAAKHGLLGLARSVREEVKTRGIRVTTVLPGATLTPSWAGSDEPDERFMPPDDIAAAILGAYRLTGRSVMEEILLRPQLGDL